MNSKKLIGLAVLIFVFVIACAGTSEKSGTEQLSEQDLSFNPSEPWTGKWKVEGFNLIDGLWGLKQSGSKVVSTHDSFYNIKAKVVDDELKGKVTDLSTSTYFFSFEVKISSDGQSFKGTAGYDNSISGQMIKGTRQE